MNNGKSYAGDYILKKASKKLLKFFAALAQSPQKVQQGREGWRRFRVLLFNFKQNQRIN